MNPSLLFPSSMTWSRSLVLYLHKLQTNCSRLRFGASFSDDFRIGMSADDLLSIQDFKKMCKMLYVDAYKRRGKVTDFVDYRSESVKPILLVDKEVPIYYIYDYEDHEMLVKTLMLVISLRDRCPEGCRFCYAQTPQYGSKTRYEVTARGYELAIQHILYKIISRTVEKLARYGKEMRPESYHFNISIGGSSEPFYDYDEIEYIIRYFDDIMYSAMDIVYFSNSFIKHRFEFFYGRIGYEGNGIILYDKELGRRVLTIMPHLSLTTCRPVDLAIRLEHDYNRRMLRKIDLHVGVSWRPDWMERSRLIKRSYSFCDLYDAVKTLIDLGATVTILVLMTCREPADTVDDGETIGYALTDFSTSELDSISILPLLYKPVLPELQALTPDKIYELFLEPLIGKLEEEYRKVPGDFLTHDLCLLTNLFGKCLCREVVDRELLWHYDYRRNRLYIPEICPLGGTCTALG